VKTVFHSVSGNFYFWQCSEEDHGEEEKSKEADHEKEVCKMESRTGAQQEEIGKIGGEEEGREKEVCFETKGRAEKAGSGSCTGTSTGI